MSLRALPVLIQGFQLDADAPSRSSPTARNLRHYLAGNYTRSGSNSTLLPTAQRLAIPDAQLRPFTPFTNPSPAPNTGVHRFIFALYTQPARFNTAGFESVGMETTTQNWNVGGPVNGGTWISLTGALACSFRGGGHSLGSAQPSAQPSLPLTRVRTRPGHRGVQSAETRLQELQLL